MARSCPRPANSPRRYPGQPVPVGVIGVGNMGQTMLASLA